MAMQGLTGLHGSILCATELVYPQLHSPECLQLLVLPESEHLSATAPVP